MEGGSTKLVANKGPTASGTAACLLMDGAVATRGGARSTGADSTFCAGSSAGAVSGVEENFEDRELPSPVSFRKLNMLDPDDDGADGAAVLETGAL